MTKTLQRRTLMGGLIAALAPRGAAAADRAGEVETSRGDCFATAAAARRPLAPPAAVFVGDTVATGEQAALGLLLGTATQVRLGPKARLRIDRFIVQAGGTLELQEGGLVFDHDTEKAGAMNVAIRSPFGLIAVRGTRFFAGPSNGVFGVFVARGAVMVVGANQAVMVQPGMGTNIARPGAEPTAPAPWGKPRIDAAMASVM